MKNSVPNKQIVRTWGFYRSIDLYIQRGTIQEGLCGFLRFALYSLYSSAFAFVFAFHESSILSIVILTNSLAGS